MSATDGMLFIDSTGYLELYQLTTVRSLLRSIAQQREHIFISEQIVREVERGKVRVAARALAVQLKRLETCGVSVTEHLLADADDTAQKLREQLAEISNRIKSANAAFLPHGVAILDRITRSEDGVSKALEPLFATAKAHNAGELERARSRKERGIPPGKADDPLGDELTWEQLLAACEGKTRLWIVTNDSDYVDEYGGKCFLNASLYRELASRLGNPCEVFCFTKIEQGIEHFTKVNHLNVDNLPSPEEAAEIQREREQLPPIGWMSNGSDAAAFIAIADAHRRNQFAAVVSSSGGMVIGPPPEERPPGGSIGL